MSLSCEQLFYGRGERGYGILGQSPGAAPFRKRVEALCGAVGTPTAEYGGEPFLVSAPEGDRVVMLCGLRGTPDSMKRETLFFHALVAEKKALVATKADAFTLFAQEAFGVALPHGKIPALAIDVRRTETGGAASSRASFPCFIRSSKPENDPVRSLVGMDANERTWATFAFQALDSFDVQVLPPRIPAPPGTREYDTTGKLICAAKAVPQKTVEATDEEPYARQVAASTDTTPSKYSALLKLSLFANIVLAAACCIVFALKNDGEKQPTGIPRHDSLSQSLSNEITRLTATNGELSSVKESLEKKIQELRRQLEDFESQKSARDSLVLLEQYFNDMPEYFADEQIAQIPDWEQNKTSKNIYVLLSEWTEFFTNHPKPERIHKP